MKKLIIITILFAGISIKIDANETTTDRLVKASYVASPNKYYCSICAIFKNEARYLKEWIEYHRLIGIDHFYLYDNDSTDKPMQVLKPYLQAGIVTLVSWSDHGVDRADENSFIWPLAIKIPAYENAAKVRALHATTWLVFLDVTEYLVVPSATALGELLGMYHEYPGILLKSDFFNSLCTGLLTQQPELLIESIERTAPRYSNILHSSEKIIFKPDCYEYFTWPPYKCMFKNNQSPVVIRTETLRINHYMNHHPNETFPIAIDRQLVSENEIKQVLEQGYNILDYQNEIPHFVPEIRKKICDTE